MKRPELLLPAGNFESLNAVIKAGADAVYVALKQFSPNHGDENFTLSEIEAIKNLCSERKIKLLITLNSVVKNTELGDLYKVLHSLHQIGPYALIIQDLGILHMVRKNFPNFRLHASVQMAFHNSLGIERAKKQGFSRIVLARELTKKEILATSFHEGIETEVFIQGALCYSFSGVCLFSSYLGGSGANREKCTEPCKKEFLVKGKSHYPFNLKESFQVDNIALLLKANIDAFKVEGRSKTATYVYRIGSAYRKLLDGDVKTGQKELKQLQACTESTSWFLGDEVDDAFATKRFADNYVGKVLKVKWRSVIINCSCALEFGDRLRIEDEQGHILRIKIKEFKNLEGCRYEIRVSKPRLPLHGRIYIEGKIVDGFLSNIDDKYYQKTAMLSPGAERETYFKSIQAYRPNHENKSELFVRIDEASWLQKLDIKNWDFIILSFSHSSLLSFATDEIDLEMVIVELPLFIPEQNINDWRNLCLELKERGIKNFMISHLSQINLIPTEVRLLSNENVYQFNDAAIACVKEEGIEGFVYPFENDRENLENIKCKDGIVPVFYHPKLFYSRMPVSYISQEGIGFEDKKGEVYRKRIKDGITVIYPEKPVSIVHWREKLLLSGYRKFLFDYSGIHPSRYLSPKVLSRFFESKSMNDSSTFNFENGLK